MRREVVEAIHEKLLNILPLDEILVCYHDDRDNCSCRKPRPGLLINSAKRLSINLAESFMIGDRWRDIEAGQNAGCWTIFIDYGYSEQKLGSPADVIVGSLQEAAKWILQKSKKIGDIRENFV